MGVNLEVPQKVKPIKVNGWSIRNALLALPDDERAFIVSTTPPGCFTIYEMYRKPNGNVGYSYNNVPQ